MKTFEELCRERFCCGIISSVQLPQSGGDRRYFRLLLDNGLSVLGVEADNIADARAYCGLTKVFRSNSVNVPEVYAHTSDYSAYLVQDLGDKSLFSALDSEDADSLVRRTLSALVRMQTISSGKWRDCVGYRPFLRRQVMWDLNYFKYEYLKQSRVVFDEDLLENDFERFAGNLTSIPGELWGFMMRDCQSRNVLLADDGENKDVPYFIDFQGGRFGPCLYDAVSLLWQARAGFSHDFRHEMMRHYAEAFAKERRIDPMVILAHVEEVALFRTLQVLGAYGFRGLVQKRALFIESIPGALANLRELLDGSAFGSGEYPELERVCRELVDDKRFQISSDNRLHIRVFSFSYKKGYPDDFTGNGGGFMFDCRGMHNPGRYEEYKPLTGLDQPVIDFLKERGETDPFVDKAIDMVSPTVECYQRRGFRSLQIGFGCTGGRHRSVYCAQAVGLELARKYPDAVVEIIHREQGLRFTPSENL